MAENDEPLDDLRAVAMAAAATTARIAETALRDQQQKTQHRQEEQRRQAISSLVTRRPTLDSPQRRAETDAGMKSAGVPDEVRQAKSTADLLNGTDPQLAAAAGSKAGPKAKRPTKTPEKQRTR